MLPWVTLTRFQQKTWVWGCSAREHPFLPTTEQPSLCHRAHKKSSGPSAPGAREHNPPPAPSQEEQKAFFFPSLQLLNTSKRGINTYRPSLFPSSVPSPCDYVSALLSLPAFHIRNSPHSPQRELQNWVS